MEHESTSTDGWVINDSEENFETWVDREFISDDLRKQLRKADILIVPTESFNRPGVPVFPEKTDELFDFLKRDLPEGLDVDICIEDGDYKGLALYADLVIIPSFVVMYIVLPILLNLVSNYIYQKISKPESRNIKTTITVVNENGQSKNLSYEGPVDGFGSIIDAVENIWED